MVARLALLGEDDPALYRGTRLKERRRRAEPSSKTVPRKASRGDRLFQVYGRRLAHQAQVERLDEHREAHREVHIALRDVLAEPVGDERDADEQEEGHGEHLDRLMRVRESSRRMCVTMASVRPTVRAGGC